MGGIFRSLLSTAERRLTADHLDKIFCTRLRSSMGGIFRSLFIYRRASAYSSNFWNAITLELRVEISNILGKCCVDPVQQYIHRSAPMNHTFLPASRSTLLARDPHFPPGMPFKLLGYIYSIPTIYIYIYAASTASGHRWSPAATIYIFLCGDTYIMNVTERQMFW